jgi:hypothetical protein
MQAYVKLLNQLHSDGKIEQWWIQKVREFFSKKPFVLRMDPTKSLRSVIADLLRQAQRRQQEETGTMFVGIVLQHLVGAKLDIILGGIPHHGASVADDSTGRTGDFFVGDVALHVTTAPGEALIRKCQNNLGHGHRPLIITIQKSVQVAEGLLEQAGIGDRVDVLDAEQFLAGNLYELGKFQGQGRRDSADQLIAKYNEIVKAHETDPSLGIVVGGDA